MPFSPFDSEFKTHSTALKAFIVGKTLSTCPELMSLRALSSHLHRMSNVDNNADYFDFVQLSVKIPTMSEEISKTTTHADLVAILKPLIAMKDPMKKHRLQIQKEHNPYQKIK